MSFVIGKQSFKYLGHVRGRIFIKSTVNYRYEKGDHVLIRKRDSKPLPAVVSFEERS